MTDTRTLKTIVRNMLVLYRAGLYRDLSVYQAAVFNGLGRLDRAAIKQAFKHYTSEA